MNCDICKDKLNFINKHKTKNGAICHNCYKLLPNIIKNNIKEYTDTKLRVIKDNLKPDVNFEKTVAYGDLSIDERKGFFQIKDGNNTFTFNGLDLVDGYMQCTNLKVNKQNQVFCDVEFYMNLESPHIETKAIIMKNVKCHCKKVQGGTKLEWEEPSDLVMFKNLFNNMLKQARIKYNEQFKEEIITKQDVDYLKAKALFLVNDNYHEEEIKEIRNKYIKMYHPDEINGDTEKTQTILRYYEILIDNLLKGDN